MDLIFPVYCQICENHTPDRAAICKECEELFIPQSSSYCRTCAEQLPASMLLGEECIYCQKLHFSFSFAVTAYVMNPHLRHCIHVFKYQKGTFMAPFLIKCLAHGFQDERLKDLPRDEWVISSVPVHHIRERERGYNQSEMLALGISERLGFPYAEYLQRTIHTPHQAQLNKAQRAQNIKGAFILHDECEKVSENIILIDDVFTTGATTDACTKVLKREGAKEVIVVCLARR